MVFGGVHNLSSYANNSIIQKATVSKVILVFNHFKFSFLINVYS